MVKERGSETIEWYRQTDLWEEEWERVKEEDR